MILCDFVGILKRSIATIESIENPYQDYFIIKLKPKEVSDLDSRRTRYLYLADQTDQRQRLACFQRGLDHGRRLFDDRYQDRGETQRV